MAGSLGRLGAPRLVGVVDLELVRLFCWGVGPTSGGISLGPTALPLEAAAVASGTSPGCWPASWVRLPSAGLAVAEPIVPS